MIKAMVVYGTRPEAVKLKPVIDLLRSDAAFEVNVVCSQQHRELLVGVGVTPDFPYRKMMDPQVVLVQGDTRTAFQDAVYWFERGVPIAHVEAGIRSGDIRNPWPEEFYRVAIDTIADCHFAPTNWAATNCPKGAIYVTGNTGIDALYARQKPVPITKRGIAVQVTLHRRESFGQPMRQIVAGVIASALAHPEHEFIWALHPNPRVQEAVPDRTPPNLRITQARLPDLFVCQLARSKLVITDSGGVQEEAAALGVPCVVARDVTDRPESVEAGLAYLAGRTPEGVQRGVEWALARGGEENPPPIFGDGHASERIVAALKERYGC